MLTVWPALRAGSAWARPVEFETVGYQPGTRAFEMRPSAHHREPTEGPDGCSPSTVRQHLLADIDRASTQGRCWERPSRHACGDRRRSGGLSVARHLACRSILLDRRRRAWSGSPAWVRSGARTSSLGGAVPVALELRRLTSRRVTAGLEHRSRRRPIRAHLAVRAGCAGGVRYSATAMPRYPCATASCSTGERTQDRRSAVWGGGGGGGGGRQGVRRYGRSTTCWTSRSSERASAAGSGARRS